MPSALGLVIFNCWSGSFYPKRRVCVFVTKNQAWPGGVMMWKFKTLKLANVLLSSPCKTSHIRQFKLVWMSVRVYGLSSQASVQKKCIEMSACNSWTLSVRPSRHTRLLCHGCQSQIAYIVILLLCNAMGTTKYSWSTQWWISCHRQCSVSCHRKILLVDSIFVFHSNVA